MIPTAHIDQLEAACREVRLYVARLAKDPPLGTRVVEGDQDVNDSIWHRLMADIEDNTVQYCCKRTRTPRPLYWLPRYNALLCDEHWNIGGYCLCFKECDACARPIEEASVVFMFMKMYIVQAILCLECESRVRLSPAGG
jgi:hypothetical protein